jgi:hypothetical protein
MLTLLGHDVSAHGIGLRRAGSTVTEHYGGAGGSHGWWCQHRVRDGGAIGMREEGGISVIEGGGGGPTMGSSQPVRQGGERCMNPRRK